MKIATEYKFNIATGSIDNYNYNKTLLGSLLRQYTGSTANQCYVAPLKTIQINPTDLGGLSGSPVHVHRWSDRYYWIFLGDVSAAALTRRIQLYIYDSIQESISYSGAVTLNYTGLTGNKTTRSLRACIYNHYSGSIRVNGTGVTGSNTNFVNDRIAAGARIGFYTTSSAEVSSWYDISSIQSNTNLVIGSNVGTINSGSSYIIEEIRLLHLFTNSTAANGGLTLVKGLNFGTFTQTPTNINESTTIDNIRAMYHLKDSATTGMQISYGIGLDDMENYQTHYVYVLNADSTTTPRIYKLNLRQSLTVASGQSTSAYIYRTGAPTVTGTISQNNNGRIFSVRHGIANGIKSFWFCTTTRVYRCPVTSIVDSSTTFLSDFMLENPPGGSGTYSQLSNFGQVDYSDAADRLVITNAIAPFRLYCTQYYTDGSQFENIFSADISRLKLTTTDSNMPNILAFRTVPMIWTEGGLLFATTHVTTTGQNNLFVFPFSVDWDYTTNTKQQIISSKIALSNPSKLYTIYANALNYVGDGNVGYSLEAYRLYVRTSGIDDNTGSWTLVDGSGDISNISSSGYIQFMIEFKILGNNPPNRIYSVVLVYEDSSQDYHYEPSLTYSSATNRYFAWRQAIAWSSDIPNLRIRLYNVSNNLLLLDDTVNSSSQGIWQYSSNGISWSSWDETQDSVGYYIRYVATSLPSNITVRALLTQA